MDILILQTQEGDWEGLYIDGKIIDQGHNIGEGNRLFLLKKAEEFNFKSSDIRVKTLNDSDENNIIKLGNLPDKLNDLVGPY